MILTLVLFSQSASLSEIRARRSRVPMACPIGAGVHSKLTLEEAIEEGKLVESVTEGDSTDRLGPIEQGAADSLEADLV